MPTEVGSRRIVALEGAFLQMGVRRCSQSTGCERHIHQQLSVSITQYSTVTCYFL